MQPSWFTRFVAVPVRDWLAVVVLPAPVEGHHDLGRACPGLPRPADAPVLRKVHRAGSVDLVRVGLVTGQAPADFAAKTENLAHAFGARLCRVRDVAPGNAAAGAGPR